MPVYDTKALLVSLAEIALLNKSKPIYKAIMKIANVEDVKLASYEEALAELEADRK